MSQLKNVKVLACAGMLIALAALLSFFSVPITNVLEIRFKFLPIAFAGWLFGPAVGGVVGGAADVIGYLVKPTGPFMPGFTLSTIVAGVLRGLVLGKKPFSVRRIFLSEALNTAVVGLFLNTLNLTIGYGMPFRQTLLARIPQEVIMYPCSCALLIVSMRALNGLRMHVAASVR